MDAVDILKVCLRRWYVMLPIVMGAAGVSYQLMQDQQSSYTAAASYGLVQPSITPGDDGAVGNPLGPGGSTLVGAALQAQLNSRETQAELGTDATRGWGPGQVVNNRFYYVQIPQNETTYEVRAWGEDEDAVRAVVDRVIAASPAIADDLQIRAGVPPRQRFQPFVLAPTQVEVLPSMSGAKLVVAVMGVGLLMGAAWSIIADRVLRWRRAMRRAPDGDGAQDAVEQAVPVHQTEPTPAPSRRGSGRTTSKKTRGGAPAPQSTKPPSAPESSKNGSYERGRSQPNGGRGDASSRVSSTSVSRASVPAKQANRR